MELDEFKAHWNIIQDKEFQQQKIEPQKLEQIIMNITETLSQMQAKSAYWKRVGKFIIQFFLGLLAMVFLITCGIALYKHSKVSTVLVQMLYFAILIAYCMVTNWVYNRQQQIFTLHTGGSVRDGVKQTVTAFRQFYWQVNAIYLFLYPAYYYAVIKLLIPYWHPSAQTILVTVTAATVISLAGGYWYYRVKFFKKLKSLEANLADLDEGNPGNSVS